MNSVTETNNWKLQWNSYNNRDGSFTVFFNNDQILTKKMYGNICRTFDSKLKKNVNFLTFVETSEKFDFELFDNFIKSIEADETVRFVFDAWDGCEAFKYKSETKVLTFEFSKWSSNMDFTLKLTDDMRMQFAEEFKKFLDFYKQYFESKNKPKTKSKSNNDDVLNEAQNNVKETEDEDSDDSEDEITVLANIQPSSNV